MFSESYDFTSDDHDGTNGSPVGANPSAFWDAFSFEVSRTCTPFLSISKFSPELTRAHSFDIRLDLLS